MVVTKKYLVYIDVHTLVTPKSQTHDLLWFEVVCGEWVEAGVQCFVVGPVVPTFLLGARVDVSEPASDSARDSASAS